MAQSWHDLVFAHWPVDAAVLRPLIPQQLHVDSFEGTAWLAVVPFRMTGVRLHGTPAVPRLSAFPELNVRTYVTFGERPGVWFFSLDARNALAVAIARAWFHLPYFRARMSCKERDGWIHYDSERTHHGVPAGLLKGRYRSVGKVFSPQRGTLEHFLTERYLLVHERWPRPNHSRRDSSSSMAAAARGSRTFTKLDGRRRGSSASRVNATLTFCEEARCPCVETSESCLSFWQSLLTRA